MKQDETLLRDSLRKDSSKQTVMSEPRDRKKPVNPDEFEDD